MCIRCLLIGYAIANHQARVDAFAALRGAAQEARDWDRIDGSGEQIRDAIIIALRESRR